MTADAVGSGYAALGYTRSPDYERKRLAMEPTFTNEMYADAQRAVIAALTAGGFESDSVEGPVEQFSSFTERYDLPRDEVWLLLAVGAYNVAQGLLVLATRDGTSESEVLQRLALSLEPKDH